MKPVVGPRPRAELVAEGMAERSKPLEQVLFATSDPAAVVELVAAYCGQVLGAAPARFVFYFASVGAVYGIELEDGRRVVVKAHGARVDESYLGAIAELRLHVAGRGLPAPRAVAPVTPWAGAILTSETMLDAGRRPDPFDPAERDVIASGLATFVAVCRDFGDAARFGGRGSPLPEELWPEPHDIRFDFAATAGGAEWIDAIGARALARRRAHASALARVVGHGDWRREHLRVDQGRLCAIYDWDSVSFAPETTFVAAAMRTFPADWSEPERRQYPTWPEMHAFLQAYERARGEPFGMTERAHLGAELAYGAAYAARCEHSDRCTDFGNRAAVPHAPAAPPGTMAAFLCEHAEALVESATADVLLPVSKAVP